MFKFWRDGENGKREEGVGKFTGPISSPCSFTTGGVGGGGDGDLGPAILTPTPGADPPPGYSKAEIEIVVPDKDREPDLRTDLHRAKSKKLMSPSSLEEIGSTTWVKKVNALAVVLNWRSPPDLMKDAAILDHFLKHKKVTVLVHDLVLVVVWRNEILPKLVELKQEETTAAIGQGQGAPSRLSRSTIYMVVNHAYNLSKLMAALLSRPEILLSLGSCLHDLIDFAVGELRYFIENKPDHDPAKDKPFDFDQRVNENNTLAAKGLCYEQQCCYSLNCLSIFFAILGPQVIDKLPPDVLLKLIHPDTRYIITLVDLVLTRPASYSKRKYGFLKFIPKSNPGRRRGRVPLDSLEAGSWSLLDSVFIYDAAKFPVSTVSQMTQECYDKVMLLRTLLQRERLLKAMPELEELQKFLRQLASNPPKLISSETTPSEAETPSCPPGPVPSSPNFVDIQAQLETNRDAIIRIHNAMGTFEEGPMNDTCRRLTRDNYCLLPLCNMNNCCFYCAKIDAELRCSRCRYAHYCNKKCQSKEWGTHKLICSR